MSIRELHEAATPAPGFPQDELIEWGAEAWRAYADDTLIERERYDALLAAYRDLSTIAAWTCADARNTHVDTLIKRLEGDPIIADAVASDRAAISDGEVGL